MHMPRHISSPGLFADVAVLQLQQFALLLLPLLLFPLLPGQHLGAR